MKTGVKLIEEICATETAPGTLAFWWMGQLGYAVRMGGLSLYLDLYLKDDPRRLHAPVCRAQEVAGADYIFGSHDHSDHIDHSTWPALAAASPTARFVVPAALAERLSGALGIDPGRFVPMEDGVVWRGEGIEITGVAAAHEQLETDALGRHLCMGYVVRAGGATFCHTGDTCIWEGLHSRLRALAPIDALFLPINGRDAARYRSGCIGNMTFQEAVDLCGAVRPRLCVPGHYDMFAGNCADPLSFADYLDAKYPGLRCWIGEYGALQRAGGGICV